MHYVFLTAAVTKYLFSVFLSGYPSRSCAVTGAVGFLRGKKFGSFVNDVSSLKGQRKTFTINVELVYFIFFDNSASFVHLTKNTLGLL